MFAGLGEFKSEKSKTKLFAYSDVSQWPSCIVGKVGKFLKGRKSAWNNHLFPNRS